MPAFNPSVQRLGTVCIITDDNHKNIATIGTITQKYLSTRSKREQHDKIVSKLKQNLQALMTQLRWIANQPSCMRLFRISSNLLPMYDHPEYNHPYTDFVVSTMVKSSLRRAGDFCREHDIRIAMHPDQYCVINSDKPDVVRKSLNVLYMHEHIITCMGYGQQRQDCTVNIHLNGKTDTVPVEDMSPALRNVLTFENDERTGTVERCLDVCNKYDFPVLYDIHHDWCSRGDYSTSDSSSELLGDVLATWQGARPLFHVSQPTEAVWSCDNTLPDMNSILQTGNNPRDAWKHSDYITNEKLVDIVREMLILGDIEVEAKAKNHAVSALHRKLN